MIHIENIHIHVNPHQQRNSIAEAMLKAVFTASESVPEPDDNNEEIVVTPPPIGEYWEGQGGIYAGVMAGSIGQSDYHLILAMTEPQEDFTWEDAKAYAQTIAVDGHQDFTLPTRFESALLFANLRYKFNFSHWYWTGTEKVFNQSSYKQHFGVGTQSHFNNMFETRARFVRRVALHPHVTESDV